MKKILTIFLLLAMSTYGDAFFWQVNDTATVDGTAIQSFLVPYHEDDDNWNVVRVKLVAPDKSVTYLPVYFGDGVWEDGSDGMYIGEQDDGRWGTGHWGTQTEIQNVSDKILNGYSIAAELGRWEEDSVELLILAETRPELLTTEFVSTYMYKAGTLWPEPVNQWTPTEFYTSPPTPEPSSGILFLIGLSFLLLKRPKPFT